MADSILAQPTPTRNSGKKTAEVSEASAVWSRSGFRPASPLFYQRLISYSSALLVFLLATGAFVLSYATLWDTALAYGLPPRLAWIWPLLVDFALVVFSLAVVRASLYNERTWWPWLLVALYTIATVAFNILHAPVNLTAQVVAVVAPLSLFLSFETLMAMLKSEVRRKQRVQSLEELQTGWTTWQRRLVRHEAELTGRFESWQVEIEQMSQRLAELDQQLQQQQLQRVEPEPVQGVTAMGSFEEGTAQAELQIGPASIQARRTQVKTLAAEGLSQFAIAGQLKVSLSTVKRDLAALQPNDEG
jgi:DNA-binding CsgD family transcriptional regulator